MANKDTQVPEPTERELAWTAFLERARKVNPVRFDAQKANGEFDTIPINWNG